MATNWRPTTRKEWYKLGVVTLWLSVIGVTALMVGAMSADAQTSVGGFTVDDVNRTVSGNVSDVTVSSDITYNHDVPDAERRIIRLQIGTSSDDLETIGYRNTRDVAGTDSGTVTLSGSALEHSGVSAADVDPALADSETTTLVVAANITVYRSNGETVTNTATDTVTLTLSDDNELSAEVGGSGSVSVSTA